jgi:hypothetical protein
MIWLAGIIDGMKWIAFDGVLEPGMYMSSEQQESLRNLGGMIARIRATNGTGRLALRNTARMGTLHLYFERGQLVHLEGSRASIDDALIDLAGWSEGVMRFDAGVSTERRTVTPAQQDFFHRTVLLMQQRGSVRATFPLGQFSVPPERPGPMRPPTRPLPENPPAPLPPIPPRQQPERFVPPIDMSPASQYAQQQPRYRSPSGPQGDRRLSAMSPLFSSAPIVSSRAEVLLSARQWELLVEVMHAVVESVGHLFGQQQAQNILQHVLVECSEESDVLSLLQVDRQGWLRELRVNEMMTQPVRDVAPAFVLLIRDFEGRCAALLGEEKARQIIARALYPHHNGLAEIGIALN